MKFKLIRLPSVPKIVQVHWKTLLVNSANGYPGDLIFPAFPVILSPHTYSKYKFSISIFQLIKSDKFYFPNIAGTYERALYSLTGT